MIARSSAVVSSSKPTKEYNGYKIYDETGCQLCPDQANKVIGYVNAIEDLKAVPHMDLEEAAKKGLYQSIGSEVLDAFLKEVRKQSLYEEPSNIKIVYTPLHGTGNIPVRTILSRAGFKNVSVVKEQEMPDGKFPTCPYPNPEIRQVFECGLKMTETEKADLMLATDPDCDRVGIAVLTNGEYVLLSGNDVGVLLANYILSARQAKGLPTEGMFMTKSFVSTPLFNKVAAKYGCTVVDVLTGFKYVGEFIANLEKKGEEDRFLMGFEDTLTNRGRARRRGS